MKPSSPLAYLRPPKPKPNRSPFTRPTTYLPPTLSSAHQHTSKQTNFNHLVHHAIPASAQGTSARPALGVRKSFYFVHFADRVKFWNISAGDRVIVADSTQTYRGKIGTVYWVDRTTNRLTLLEPEFWVSFFSPSYQFDYKASELKISRNHFFFFSFLRGARLCINPQTDQTEKPHPGLPEYTRSVPVEFEYSTIRLMAPGSDELSADLLPHQAYLYFTVLLFGSLLIDGLAWECMQVILRKLT